MSLGFRILTRNSNQEGWKEFIKYSTKQECIDYLEKVNPTLRPALIVRGEQTLRAYDHGIIDYEYINEVEQENQQLKKLKELYESAIRKVIKYHNAKIEKFQKKHDETKDQSYLTAIFVHSQIIGELQSILSESQKK